MRILTPERVSVTSKAADLNAVGGFSILSGFMVFILQDLLQPEALW